MKQTLKNNIEYPLRKIFIIIIINNGIDHLNNKM